MIRVEPNSGFIFRDVWYPPYHWFMMRHLMAMDQERDKREFAEFISKFKCSPEETRASIYAMKDEFPD